MYHRLEGAKTTAKSSPDYCILRVHLSSFLEEDNIKLKLDYTYRNTARIIGWMKIHTFAS